MMVAKTCFDLNFIFNLYISFFLMMQHLVTVDQTYLVWNFINPIIVQSELIMYKKNQDIFHSRESLSLCLQIK